MATETTATFTPGPWTICLGSGQHLMTGVAHFYADGRTEFIADCLPDYALETGRVPVDHRPNMQLIAAAPDMYEALKRVVRDVTGWDGDVMDIVDAAIAKAEGQK